MKRNFIILLFIMFFGVINNNCYAEEVYSETDIQQAEETKFLVEAPIPTAIHYKKDSLITDYYPYSEDVIKDYQNIVDREFNGQFSKDEQ